MLLFYIFRCLSPISMAISLSTFTFSSLPSTTIESPRPKFTLELGLKDNLSDPDFLMVK